MTAYHPTKLADYPLVRLLFIANHALIIPSFNSDYSDNILHFLNSHPTIFSFYWNDAIHHVQGFCDRMIDDNLADG